MKHTDVILNVKNLSTWFYTEEGVVKALEGVSFSLEHGEILGIVGETGCGKSVTAASIMKLIPQPPGKIVEGQVLLDGRDLVRLGEQDMLKIRGTEISMIFQDPMSYLNPVLTVGFQVMESVMAHGHVTEKKARERAVEMFRKVNLPDPEKSLSRFPHQFSGGMKQRVMIAMAIINNPKLLIADEPTTALDVSIQAQILSLIKNLQKEFGSSVIIISHDLGVIATMAEKVAVMYAGGIVEYGTVKNIFDNPLHPYTRGLIGAIPRLDKDQEFLEIIPGNLPNLLDLPIGCKFEERCPLKMEVCSSIRPVAKEVEEGHEVACHAYS